MRSVVLSSLPRYLQEAYRNQHGTSTTSSSSAPSDDAQIPVLTVPQIHQLPSIQRRLFELLLRRHDLTEQIAHFGKCYPPTIFARAETYEALEYDDLAAFDAYVVYTLCQKETGDEFVTDLEAHFLSGESWHPDAEVVSDLLVKSLALLVRCLTKLGATEDASVKRSELRELLAVKQGDDDTTQLTGRRPDENELLQWRPVLRGPDDYMEDIQELFQKAPRSKFGSSRREVYPWSTYEPARNTPESVLELNNYLSGIAPHLEAKVTALPAFDETGNAADEPSLQLGLFAKIDLEPGQQILSEKSLLTAIRPLEDALCDACGQDLEGISYEDVCQCDGEDCDVTFCSQDCKDRAVGEYHRPNLEQSGSGVDDDEDEEDITETNTSEAGKEDEHDEVNGTESEVSPAPFCGDQDLSLIGRQSTTKTPEWDLYFLLLTRTVAMSVTQSVHPLNLTAIKYLWGDFNPLPISHVSNDLNTTSTVCTRTLPFSLTHNLQYPLDFFSTLALSHPSATPYSRSWVEHFDPWILQTLFAKFRGVANATQSTFDGLPEIAAVHPGWCLANHSCAPNVRWDPKGTRKFFVRTTEELAGVSASPSSSDTKPETKSRSEDGGQEKDWMGIRAGQEIFSHYTDVRLPVQERRERLREVLGGTCQCERCLHESMTEPSEAT